MRSAHPPRSRIAATIVTALCIVLGAGLLPASSASADTVFPPGTGAFTVKVTAKGVDYNYPAGGPGPTIPGLANGDDVTVQIADAPGGPDVNFARLRVRQCVADREVSNNTEFNPQITNRCSSVTMGDGTNLAFADSGPVEPGTTSLSLPFKVGVGTTPDIEEPVFGQIIPGFQCGVGHNCKLVVNVEVSSGVGSSNYVGFPIVFGAAPTAPGAPTGVSATAGDAQATVSWTAPASNGGTPITNYTVTSTPGGFTCTRAVAPLNCTVNGLTNGQAYTFKVKATNAIGTGPESAASNSVTPQPPADGALFTGITPKRIVDSRPGTLVGLPSAGPWTAGQTKAVTVAGGTTTVPADATAVTLNVTVTDTTAASFLTLWPTGTAKPNASSLNWDPGWTVPNSVTVKVGSGGRVSVFNNLGSAHVIVDVVGYYKPSTGAGFSSVTPKRLFDSRAPGGGGQWSAGETRQLTVAGGTSTVPADADSVALNVTATDTNQVSFLSIWPAGQTKPTVSSLNWNPGWTIPNAVTVKVGSGGQISIFNFAGKANVIVDVIGYFKLGTGSQFHPLAPIRILDSRNGTGGFSTPWDQRTIRNLDVTVSGVPDNADAVLTNMTVNQTTATSFLSVWPNGVDQPTVSSLNWSPGWTIPNSVTAKVGTGGLVRLFNFSGRTHVIADLSGWYG